MELDSLGVSRFPRETRMRQLKRLLRPLKDPRASNVRHDLVEIIVIALAATLAGAKTCTDHRLPIERKAEA